MTKESLPHNFREHTNCVHHISSYTSQAALLHDCSLKLAHVWGSFSHKVLCQFFSNSLISFERFFSLTFLMAYLAFLYQFLFWLWICGFYIVQTVKLRWDIQGDDLVTTFDLLVFPNFAMTTIFHGHRLKQIFLTCELFLPEHLPSGETMINRRWCYNY